MTRSPLPSIPLFCLTYTLPFALLEGAILTPAGFAQATAALSPDFAPSPAPETTPAAPAPLTPAPQPPPPPVTKAAKPEPIAAQPIAPSPPQPTVEEPTAPPAPPSVTPVKEQGSKPPIHTIPAPAAPITQNRAEAREPQGTPSPARQSLSAVPQAHSKLDKPDGMGGKTQPPSSPLARREAAPDSVPAWLEVSFWRDRLAESTPLGLNTAEKAELRQLQRELGQSRHWALSSDIPPAAQPQAAELPRSRHTKTEQKSLPPNARPFNSFLQIDLPLNSSPQIAQNLPQSSPPGNPLQTIFIEVFPVGDPRLPADGRTTIRIAGNIRNAEGELWSDDLIVTLTASAGKFIGNDENEDAGGFQVSAIAGQFQALLQSGITAQKVRVRAAIANPQDPDETEANLTPYQAEIESFTEVQFTTHLRPSLVSGVAHFRLGPRGTDYWGSRSEFLHPDHMEGTEFDADVSLFAIGKVGEWLFIGAYNSDRALNETCDGITRLFRGPQHCEQAYPVYGDSSTVDYLTPSIDNYYVRFEQTSSVPGAEPNYVMWGDFTTQEFARDSQTYSATNRQLHGFKGNYNFGNFQFTAFYSPDTQGFQRDAIAPDGTSGYYFLSQRPIIEGSESVFLEQESLEQPGLVVERKAMNRGTDYEIDYDRGTILFRQPVQRLVGDSFEGTIVQQIIVTYQFDGTENSDTNIYGGRLQYNLSHDLNRPSWIATSYLKENEGDRDFELYGADLQIPLGNDGLITAEYAHSTVHVFTAKTSGSAYRFKINKRLDNTFTIQSYYQSVEAGFTNNASTSFRPGQTRYGAALIAVFNSTTSAQFSYDHEENFGVAPVSITDALDLFDADTINITESPVNNTLTTIRAGISKTFGEAKLGLSFVNRSREDNFGDTFDSNTSQLVTTFSVPLSEALRFRAQNELNLGESDPVYPSRTTFGLNWAVSPGISVQLAHQFQSGSLFGDNSITRLDTIAKTSLWKSTDITTRYSIVNSINGLMGQGAVGLNHQWIVAPGFRINLGYERILNDLFGVTGSGSRFAQPVTVGQRAASLGFFGGESYFIAAEYTANPNFKLSGRFERRVNSNGTNTVWGLAGSGRITPSLTTLFRYEQASSANGLLEALDDTINAKLGLAFRNPNDDRFNALLSYEYRKNPATIPQTLLIGTGTQSEDHTFALEMIYAPDWRWEFYGKYATRYSRTDLASNFSNSSQIHLGQIRATYRLGYRWDLAVEGRTITQPSAGYTELGSAIELGYYLTPDLRVGVGYSFGSVDDRDFSGYRSASGAYIGVTFKVNELFNGFGRQRPVPVETQPEETLAAAE